MMVPNLLFDLILFGVLLVTAVLDFLMPSLHGAAFLFAVGAATYVATQEMCDALARRGQWAQESLASALCLPVGGFIYYWWRNDSHLAALGLHIGLMMASLMITISVLAAFGAAFKERSPKPLVGLVLTTVGALALGVLAGLLTLEVPVHLKAIILGAALVWWKLRENVRPPAQNDMAETATGSPTAPPTHAGTRWMLIPERGTLLDRFLPVLVLGALLFLALRQSGTPSLLPSTPPAAADNGQEAGK